MSIIKIAGCCHLKSIPWYLMALELEAKRLSYAMLPKLTCSVTLTSYSSCGPCIASMGIYDSVYMS